MSEQQCPTCGTTCKVYQPTPASFRGFVSQDGEIAELRERLAAERYARQEVEADLDQAWADATALRKVLEMCEKALSRLGAVSDIGWCMEAIALRAARAALKSGGV